MKVVAFNGSARKDGNTAILVKYVFGELEKEGIETELVQLSGKKINGCIACRKCFDNQDKRCAVKDDILNDCIEKMLEAEGVILASPTYFSDVTTEMKALIDRAGYVSIANGGMYKRKVGAAVDSVTREGQAQGDWMATATFSTYRDFPLSVIGVRVSPAHNWVFFTLEVSRDSDPTTKGAGLVARESLPVCDQLLMLAVELESCTKFPARASG